MAITKIFPLFDEHRICFFDSGTRDDILAAMSTVSADKVTDIEAFTQSIMDREAIVSTGIGQGFAIPHVKNRFVPEFFITMGIIRSGVNWDAIDNQPVQIIFMIGGPDGMQNEYLSILSKLSLIIKNSANKARFLGAETPSDIIEFFRKY